MWIRTPIHLRNPLQFLQLCSHCISDSIAHIRPGDGSDSLSIDCLATDADATADAEPDSEEEKIEKRKRTVQGRKKAPSDASASPTPSTLSPAKVRSEPPPLAFYPKYPRNAGQPIIFSSTEPPPLVPILRR